MTCLCVYRTGWEVPFRPLIRNGWVMEQRCCVHCGRKFTRRHSQVEAA